MHVPGPVIFFGTPLFAVPTLEALCDAGIAPALVVTQPARPVGRGRKIVEPPVAQRARELGLDVQLVASVRDQEFQAGLSTVGAWIGVVVAFGQIFPRSLLELPEAGCVNLHASLLPKYRGAAPIQAAIASGEQTTGVTTMKMSAGLDSGPILLQEEVAIGSDETAPHLSDRLAVTGATLVVETLDRMEQGTLVEIEQDGSAATFAPKLSREDGEVDWRLSAQQIFDRWRAYTPWPGLTAHLFGEPVKVCRCGLSNEGTVAAAPGTIVSADSVLRVACGDGSSLLLEALQRPNKSVLEAREFINGEHLSVDDRFEGSNLPS